MREHPRTRYDRNPVLTKQQPTTHAHTLVRVAFTAREPSCSSCSRCASVAGGSTLRNVPSSGIRSTRPQATELTRSKGEELDPLLPLPLPPGCDL
jgi:hypothetical protein